MEKSMLVPGRIETWILLLDLRDVSLLNIPYQKLKVFIYMTKKHFPTRMFKLVCVNTNWFMKTIFDNIIAPWLDSFIKQKIYFFGDFDSQEFIDFRQQYFYDELLE